MNTKLHLPILLGRMVFLHNKENQCPYYFIIIEIKIYYANKWHNRLFFYNNFKFLTSRFYTILSNIRNQYHGR